MSDTEDKRSKIENPLLIEKKLTRAKLLVRLNLTLILLVPVLTFIISDIIDSIYSIDTGHGDFGLKLLQLLVIYDFLIILILLHIRIRKPKQDEKLSSKYIRAGWLLMRTSHHKKNRMDHEVKIGDYYFCAGCYGGAIGLFIGGIIGTIYVLAFDEIPATLGYILVIPGILLSILSFSKYTIKIPGIKRLFVNSSLPLGLWLFFIGSDILFKNFIGIICILIILVFLALERLYLSKLDHRIVDLSTRIK
jgi:hypothetical protein